MDSLPQQLTFWENPLEASGFLPAPAAQVKGSWKLAALGWAGQPPARLRPLLLRSRSRSVCAPVSVQRGTEAWVTGEAWGRVQPESQPYSLISRRLDRGCLSRRLPPAPAPAPSAPPAAALAASPTDRPTRELASLLPRVSRAEVERTAGLWPSQLLGMRRRHQR